MRVLCVLLVLGVGFTTAAGHAFTLTPMSVTFDPKGSGAARNFRVDNESSNRVAFQITVRTREMDDTGREVNRPAGDLFTVFPPQGTISPGQSQNVRLVWRGTPNPDHELSFRLVAEELPVNFTPEKNKAQIKVVLRYMAAVYVRPRTAKPNLQVTSFTRTEASSYALTVTNAGLAHQSLMRPRLALTDARGQSREVPADALNPLESENVLARQARRFVLTLPADFTEPSYAAHLTADE